MRIAEQLTALGMKDEEISICHSDLHVLKNEISEKWLSTYEFKRNVKTYVSQIDQKIWYDIPFGNEWE